MGTTVAGVVILEGELLVFNVGDSRVIEVGPAGDGSTDHGGPAGARAATDDTLHQLSVDDSPALARGRRTTSIITQALGGAPAFSAITPHVSRSPLTPGTRMLVCSDGLTDPVLDNEIDDILRAHDGGRAVFELWKAAMAAGGPDNVTIALVSVTG
jgi:serine/threonine protein phosphatase PrpC